MPNLGVAIWRTVLNIKLLCLPELLLSHLPKFIEFYLCIQMFTLAGPPCIFIQNWEKNRKM